MPSIFPCQKSCCYINETEWCQHLCRNSHKSLNIKGVYIPFRAVHQEALNPLFGFLLGCLELCQSTNCLRLLLQCLRVPYGHIPWAPCSFDSNHGGLRELSYPQGLGVLIGYCLASMVSCFGSVNKFWCLWQETDELLTPVCSALLLCEQHREHLTWLVDQVAAVKL